MISTKSSSFLLALSLIFNTCMPSLTSPKLDKVNVLWQEKTSNLFQIANLQDGFIDSKSKIKKTEGQTVHPMFITHPYFILFVFLTSFGVYFLCSVRIKEDQVGILTKKYQVKPFSPPADTQELTVAMGWISVDEKAAGTQAKVLTPGIYFYPRWQYEVLKQKLVVIPQGEIALVIAQDGASMKAGHTLGKIVPECNSFQDGEAFMKNGGEKGPQLQFLTAGTYRINTNLFTIVTANNAELHGLVAEQLRPCIIPSDKVGIVTVHDGKPIPSGEIAGSIVEEHNKFQDPQSFLKNGGCKGLQQEVLPSGTWILNPWFAEVKKVPLVEIPPGAVGVVISHVGKQHPSGREELVDPGFKGVLKAPLRTGKHPINTEVMSVEIVPTHEVTLDWKTDTSKSPLNYDSQLKSLNLRSKDGFAFNIEVTQVIKVPEESAPRMISRVGSPQSVEVGKHSSHNVSGSSLGPKYTSIRNLVTRVLEPMIGNYFRNSVQQYGALEFLDERSDRQKEAVISIREGLVEYGVQSVGTYLNEIDLPPELEKALTERKIAEQQEKTYESQQKAEMAKQKLVHLEELTDIQQQLVRAEEGLKIAELEAESQRVRGIVETDILRQEIDAFGPENYTAFKIVESLSKNNIKLVPDLSFDGKDNYGSLLLQWFMGNFLKPISQKQTNDENRTQSLGRKEESKLNEFTVNDHTSTINPESNVTNDISYQSTDNPSNTMVQKSDDISQALDKTRNDNNNLYLGE